MQIEIHQWQATKPPHKTQHLSAAEGLFDSQNVNLKAFVHLHLDIGGGRKFLFRILLRWTVSQAVDTSTQVNLIGRLLVLFVFVA